MSSGAAAARKLPPIEPPSNRQARPVTTSVPKRPVGRGEAPPGRGSRYSQRKLPTTGAPAPRLSHQTADPSIEAIDGRVPTPPDRPASAAIKLGAGLQRDASTPRFYHLSNHALFLDGGDAQRTLGLERVPGRPSPLGKILGPSQALEDWDDEVRPEVRDPLYALGEDTLRLIFTNCCNVALRAAQAVDKLSNALATKILQERAELAAQSKSYSSPVVRKPPSELVASWCMGTQAAASLQLSADGRTLTRDARNGWATGYLSHYMTRGVTTVGLVFEQLSGEACVGLLTRNFTAFETMPHESRHAIVVDAVTGRLHFKGKHNGMLALPQPAHRLKARAVNGWQRTASALRRQKVLRSGARLQIRVDMQARECTFEVRACHTPDLSSLSPSLTLSDPTLSPSPHCPSCSTRAGPLWLIAAWSSTGSRTKSRCVWAWARAAASCAWLAYERKTTT